MEPFFVSKPTPLSDVLVRTDGFLLYSPEQNTSQCQRLCWVLQLSSCSISTSSYKNPPDSTWRWFPLIDWVQLSHVPRFYGNRASVDEFIFVFMYRSLCCVKTDPSKPVYTDQADCYWLKRSFCFELWEPKQGADAATQEQSLFVSCCFHFKNPMWKPFIWRSNEKRGFF